jgi:hypothetical protein
LSRKIPETFPDPVVLEYYVVPVTSESLGRDVDTDQMWRREVNIAAIAQCCEQFFEWGYKEPIIKRFRTFLWGGVCMRVLRRAVMDSDEKEVDAHRSNRDYRGENGDDIMASPRKTGRRVHKLAVGTPSGLIQHYFQDMQHTAPSQLGCDSRDEYGGEGKELLTRVTRSREHASTDGLLEYRVEMYPAQIVRLAESGIRGLRPPLQDDLGPGFSEDEDEGEQGDEGEGGSKKKKPRKTPPDPEEPLLLWLPAVMLEMAVPDIIEKFEGIEDAKARKKLEMEQRKKDRTEGKIVTRQDKAEKADAGTPTQRGTSTVSKRKGGKSEAGVITKAFKVTKKKPAARGDKGKGNGKNRFIMASSDNSDVEEGSEDMPTSQKQSTSIATTAPRQTTKRSMLDDALDDVIASSLPNPRYTPQPFDADPFLDSIPAHSANNSKGKPNPAIVSPPEPKIQAPNPPPAPIRTARERVKFLFTQNPDYFSPSPVLGGDEEEDLLDPYAGLAPIPLMPTNMRTISTSTKASESGSSRSNSSRSAASVGGIVPKGSATMEEDEVESFEDLFVDARPVATRNRPKPHLKVQESTVSNVKTFRLPTPESNPGRRAPPKPTGKGEGKERARSASSRSSTATAEDTDEDEGGGVRKRSRQSRALDSPRAELWEEVPPLGARDLRVLPSRRGESKKVDLIELTDSEDDGTPAIVQTLVKPTININAKTTSRTENVKGMSKPKPNIADVSIIDLVSD